MAAPVTRSGSPGRNLQGASLYMTREDVPKVGITFHAELRTADGTPLEENPTGWWPASPDGGADHIVAAARTTGWTLTDTVTDGALTVYSMHRSRTRSKVTARVEAAAWAGHHLALKPGPFAP